MRSRILALALLLLNGGILSGQKTPATITDVDFRLINNQIVINYSIAGAFENEVFEIGLHFETESGRKIIPATVSGDIGKYITAGTVKTIYWNIDNDRLEVSGELKAVVTIVSSQMPVISMPGGAAQVKGEKPLGGPGYAFLSFVVPSLGGYFVEKNKTRPIIFSATEGILLIHLLNLNSKITRYESDLSDATSQSEINDLNEKIAKAEDNYYNSIATFGLIWVTDIIWVAVKGTRNMNQGKTKGTQRNYYGDGFNLKYNGDQFCLGYRITF